MDNHKTQRFPIGLTFKRKLEHRKNEIANFTITDVYRTSNSKGYIVKMVYVCEREFMGQMLRDYFVDTSIAKALDAQHGNGYVAKNYNSCAA